MTHAEGSGPPLLFLLVAGLLIHGRAASTDADEKLVMEAMKSAISDPNSKLQWSTADPCGTPPWSHIQCTGSSVTGIQFGKLGLRGSLPPNLNQLKNLRTVALQGNSFSGPLPTFNGLSSLQQAFLDSNAFDAIPADFFHGLTELTLITLDHNPLNATAGWSLSDDLTASASLAYLSLTNTSLTGAIPSFLGNIPSLQELHLAYNSLSGNIPASFSDANFVILQLNNQKGQPSLSGSIEVVANIQSLSRLWLQGNQFSGTIPESLASLVSLKDCRLNDNELVGPIPSSFNTSLSVTFLSVTNNNLDGSVPNIPSITDPKNYTFGGRNYFCVQQVGINCASQVNALLSFLQDTGYPIDLVQSWSGNDPCASWIGISCDSAGTNVVAINLPNRNMNGTISPELGSLSSLRSLILSNNNLIGSIPSTLASLASLQKIDVQNNNLSGPVPSFLSQVTLLDSGNPNINRTYPVSPTPGSASGSPTKGITPGSGNSNAGSPAAPQNTSSTQIGNEINRKSSSVSAGVVSGAVMGALAFLLVGGLVAFIIFKKKRQRFLRVQSPNTIVVHPSDTRGQAEALKITLGNSIRNSAASDANSEGSGPRDAQVTEGGSLVISIQVLRDVTNNFSQANVLGRGGFGVVYKGELDDGTKIAVKRMEASVVSSKALNEFQAEIAVLTKVRHKNLVSLLGYCIDGNERLLVYEYMPLGPLSQHLFDWRKSGLPYISWKRRLGIALDVARGMEYLHGLAHKSFIHRDLKPSNILLGDDYRAKVSDFGLVKLAPEGKFSIETRLAGTFGYLAPEYAVTGRVTTKADVFSFGVVLMELITGRRALDETQPEESMHLVTSFRRTSANKDTFLKNVDEVLEITDETFQSICTVAELAKHCTARELHQRPDMGHVVNVLSSLVEQWKPTDVDWEDSEGIDLELTLPQALKKWQAFEGFSATSDVNNSRISLPTRPTGFAESFTSTDGR